MQIIIYLVTLIMNNLKSGIVVVVGYSLGRPTSNPIVLYWLWFAHF